MGKQKTIHSFFDKSFSTRLLGASAQSKFNDIRASIFRSNFVSTYIKYELFSTIDSANKNDHELMLDDWYFCLFICRFISPDESISYVVLVLEHFLYNHRYHKLLDDPVYVRITISKILDFSRQSCIIGSTYVDPMVSKSVSNSDLIPDTKDKSPNLLIPKEAFFKVCNIFSPFFLDKRTNCSHDKLVYENSNNPDNTIRIELLGGILNHFDLSVFLCIINEVS